LISPSEPAGDAIVDPANPTNARVVTAVDSRRNALEWGGEPNIEPALDGGMPPVFTDSCAKHLHRSWRGITFAAR
jgi:hypothetical protein